MIAIIDYGLGNIRSVSKAIESIGAAVQVTNRGEDLEKAEGIILPGVGAFQKGMQNLRDLNLDSVIVREIEKGKPFLGICLGLQLLFTQSFEDGQHPGLDILKGSVKRFSNGQKVPHMGWNQVLIKEKIISGERNPLLSNLSNGSFYYFVHSYFVEPENQSQIAATTEYGQEFVSCVIQDNVMGVQFHPEKSFKSGMKILKNFKELC